MSWICCCCCCCDKSLYFDDRLDWLAVSSLPVSSASRCHLSSDRVKRTWTSQQLHLYWARMWQEGRRSTIELKVIATVTMPFDLLSNEHSWGKARTFGRLPVKPTTAVDGGMQGSKCCFLIWNFRENNEPRLSRTHSTGVLRWWKWEYIPGWGCNSDNFSKMSLGPQLCNLSVRTTCRGQSPGVATASRSSAAVFCFEGYWPNMSEEITPSPHLSAFLSSLWYPTLSMLHPASNRTEPEGGFVDGCWRLLWSHSN